MGKRFIIFAVLIIFALLFYVQLNANNNQELPLLKENISKSKVKDIINDIIEKEYDNANKSQKEAFDKLTDYVNNYKYNKKTTFNKSKKVVHFEPKNKAQMYHMLGIQFVLMYKFNPALWCFANAVKENNYKNNTKESCNYLVETASVLIIFKRYDEATKLLAYAEKGCKSDNIYATIGSLYSAQNNDEGAIKAFSRAVKYSNGEISDLYVEKLLYFLKKYNKAIEEVRKNAIEKCQYLISNIQLPSLSSVAPWIAAQGNVVQNIAQTEQNARKTLYSLDIPQSLKDTFESVIADYLTFLAENAEKFNQAIEAISVEAEPEFNLLRQGFNNCVYTGNPSEMMKRFCQCAQEYSYRFMELLTTKVLDKKVNVLMNHIILNKKLRDTFETIMLHLVHSNMDKISPADAFKLYQVIYDDYYVFCSDDASSITSTFVEPGFAEQVHMAILAGFQQCAKIKGSGGGGGSHNSKKKKKKALENAKEISKPFSKKKKPASKFELCLDGIVCAGNDNGYISMKIGGMAGTFAKFAVNVEKVDLVIQVGVGISDVTGNLGGVDFYLEGGIGKGGSHFGVMASFSASAGTLTKNYNFFLVQNKWGGNKKKTTHYNKKLYYISSSNIWQ